MKLRCEPRMPGDLPVGAMLLAMLLFIPLGAYYIDSGQFAFSQCGIKVAFNVPCLTCGATRASLHLLHGDIFQAIAMQPLVIGLYGVIVAWGVGSLWAMANYRTYYPDFTWKEGLAFFILAITVVFGNWFYLLNAGI